MKHLNDYHGIRCLQQERRSNFNRQIASILTRMTLASSSMDLTEKAAHARQSPPIVCNTFAFYIICLTEIAIIIKAEGYS
mmetsp:Transcript_56506/g.137160  ORF Transcript_56506/g.137160 Transcript_56506/m.137160 type:complete len:80 (-) Transcript_56506:1685-1924(-)